MPRLINGTNEFLSTSKPFFSVRGGQSWTEITTGDPQVMVLNTIIDDVGGDFSTSNYRFTAPVNGFYQFNFVGYFRNKDSDDDSNYYYWTFHIAGATYGSMIHGYYNAGDLDAGMGGATQKYLNAGDQAYMVAGASVTGPDYYGHNCIFSGHLLG